MEDPTATTTVTFRSKLSEEELAQLSEIHQVMHAVANHLHYRDRANAALHMDRVRYTPLTLAIRNARDKLGELIEDNYQGT